MKLWVAAVVAASALLLGLTPIPKGPASAQGQAQQSTAQRCFEHHRFGAQPVDVAKTADGQTVLAQTSWNWHDAIGCYLTLDQNALATLRAALPPQGLPNAPTDTSKRCFEHHRFGENPVDVAKTADGQTVLARLSWGYHNSIGCYLTLDNTALTTLRTTGGGGQQDGPDDGHKPSDQPTTGGGGQQDGPDDGHKPSDQPTTGGGGQLLSVEVFSKSGAQVENRSSFEVVVEFSRAVRGFDANDMNVVNGDVTRFSGSGSEYEATVTAAAPGTVVVLIPKAAALDQNGHSNETSQPFTRTARTPEIPEITATAIAAGAYHSCAIRTDGTIACWGGNYSGQTDAPAGQHTAIAAGESHSCAIRTDGTIGCWGANHSGQTDAPAGQHTAIAAGELHSCAIRTNETIACWGANLRGQTDAPAGQHTAIAAGAYHSCAIRTNGTIACWGDNLHGQTDVPAGQLSANISSDYIVAESPDNEYFDTWDRDAVLALFAAEFHRQEPDDGWTGDVESCVAGTTSQQYRDSVFQRINWFRQMAGVDSVVENPEFSYFAQQAALIMAANGALSHYPLADWTCYTSDGLKGASNSNLTVGSGVASIDNYIQDFGSNNIAVGHRRWILNPFAVEFGTGDIPNSSNALYVIPSSNQGSHETREERGFVAWPPPGYVPASVSWPRWSFDLSDPLLLADFSSASVEVFDDLGPVEVEIIYRHPLGVVWAMDGAAYSNLLAQSNSCYTVTIGDVKISGSVQTPYEYAVCIVT